jgi:coenzyme F420-0:L-glutamate ligase / coenzyme F420-1:gamma-L-glutamate ligase
VTLSAGLTVVGLHGIGEILPGAELGQLIADAIGALTPAVHAQDIVVVAQKAVSKAEGRFALLDGVVPSAHAVELAAVTRKDARLVEVILRESVEVLRAVPNVLITRHRNGYVCAQGGVDRSNVPQCGGERVLLLPENPDASAALIRFELKKVLGVAPGVIVSDSFGRPWRIGTVNIALGAAGVPALWDRRGEHDRDGRPLESTEVAWADAVAAAAGVVMGEAAEGTPVVLVRGLNWTAVEQTAQALIRPLAQDLFR